MGSIWQETYNLDLVTILVLMFVGYLMGFMAGKRFMQMRMMLVFILIFIIAVAVFLQQSGQ